MALRLYDNPISPYGRKVRATALELGITLEIVNVDLMNDEGQGAAYLKKNPNGKTPTLEEDGWYLFESTAIMQYLCEKWPEKGLYPADPKLRAEVNQWLAWDCTHFGFESVFLVYRERMFRPMMKAPTRPQFEQASFDNFVRFAGVLDRACEGKEYLVGDRFTIADFGAVGTLMFRNEAKLDLAPYPHLKAYIERIEQRDSWKKSASNVSL